MNLLGLHIGREYPHWRVKTTVRKYLGDINECKSPEERLKWLEESIPYETLVKKGNLLLNEGMDEVLSLMTGYGTPTEYDNTNAEIGVGDSNTAAVRTQSDLQAGVNYDWQGMEATFPTAPAENDGTNGRSVKFKSSWGSADGNFAWEEWSVRNGATANKNLNRKVESLGTKSGGTWTLEVEISLS